MKETDLDLILQVQFNECTAMHIFVMRRGRANSINLIKIHHEWESYAELRAHTTYLAWFHFKYLQT
jgi:hypothetical protein